MFPDNAKIASIYPLDKHTEDKHSVTNFRPVSVLNTYFSPYHCAHRKSFSTENVLFRLLEHLRQKLVKNVAVNNNNVGAVLRFI